MGTSTIAWTDDTENWASGCTEARLDDGTMSPECTHCYARLLSTRMVLMSKTGGKLYEGAAVRTGNAAKWTGVLQWDPELLTKRFDGMKGGRRVFVGSMTDLFHPDHDPAMREAMAVEIRRLEERPPEKRPIVIMLTKRPTIMREWQRAEFPKGLPGCVWPGVTAGTQQAAEERIPVLIEIKARGIKTVSMEPLLEGVDLDPARCPYCGNAGENIGTADDGATPWCNECNNEAAFGAWLDPLNGGIGWVIAGGESGAKARPSHPNWFRQVRDQCIKAGVPFHFKQFGEWKPITQMSEEETDALYRSNRKARESEDQATLDDLYGKTCTVPQLVIRDNGEHRAADDRLAYNADIPGGNFMLAYKVGKPAAGRTLDGREWDQLPDNTNYFPIGAPDELPF